MAKRTSNNDSTPNLGKVWKKAHWTIIVLMAAESNLQEDFKDVYDQMARVGSNPDEVNFVVIFDGLNLPGSPVGKVTVYHIMRNNFFQDVTDNGDFVKRFKNKKLDDLSDPKNLNYILLRVKNSFPAEHFGFIYKGHGGPNPDITSTRYIRKATFRSFVKGRSETDSEIIKRVVRSLPKIKLPKQKGKVKRELDVPEIITLDSPTTRGTRGPDSSNGGETPLMVLFQSTKGSVRELSYASMGDVLRKVFSSNGRRNGLGFVCLDSCWGQLIENGMAFKGVTQYLVASADEMAVMGIGYEGFCNFLVNRPDVFPDELADLIVSEYFQTEYNDYLSDAEFNHMGVSLTCTETTYINKIIELMRKLSDHLSDNMETHFYIIHLARLQCKAYTYDLEEDDYRIYNIDLIWFLENLQFYNRRRDGQPIDVYLNSLIAEILGQISLYYIKSYLANNYEVRKPGERNNGNGTHRVQNGKASKKEKDKQQKKDELRIKPIIGGKGIGIIFPSTTDQLNQSLYNARVTRKWLDDNWTWGTFLRKYAAKKDKLTKKVNSLAVLQKELKAFQKYQPYEKYLDRYKELAHWVQNGNGNGNGFYSLNEKLLCAKTGLGINIEHKWVKEKSLSRKLVKELEKQNS